MGEWIKEQMKSSGLTLQNPSDLSGLSKSSVYYFANDKYTPRLGTYLILCEVFANAQKKVLSEIILSGIQSMPQFQFATRRGHK